MRFSVVFILFMASCGDDSAAQVAIDAAMVDAGLDATRTDAVAADAFASDAGCAANQGLCGGVCVDTSSDPANCGSCGHDCQGGGCQVGMCQPVDLGAAGSTADGDGKAMILDIQNIYWATSASKIRRVAKSGGTATVFSDGVGILPASLYPRLAIDDTYVYWLSPGSNSPPYDGTVERVPLAGGAPTALASSQTYPADIAAHNGFIYWTIPYTGPSSDGKVMFVARGGGTPMVFSTNTFAAPLRIVVTSSGFAWTNFVHGEVDYSDFIGGPAGAAVTNLNQPIALRFSSDGFFVGTPDGPVRIQGAQRTTFPDQARNDVLAIDGMYVYWSGSDGGQAAIKRAPVGGGAAMTLHRSLFGAVDLAVDDASIYWIEDNFGGHVFRLAK